MKMVRGVYRNQQMHWVGNGFPMKSLFTYDSFGQAMSPFLLLDYASPYPFAGSERPRGVGSHPHRGFETVTIVYQGEVTHRDSTGASDTIYAGDVQWMTAGSGILHEEMHSEAFQKSGGAFEAVQLWVNLPAKDKMVAPGYQAMNRDQIPVIHLDDAGSYLRIIAGEYNGTQGAAQTYSPLNVWDGELKMGQTNTIHLPEHHQSAIVVLTGEVKINRLETVADSALVLFDNDGTDVYLEATQNSRILVLTGEPLNEPIEGHGPFVMNTKQEIIEAIRDFNVGKFGHMVS